MTPLLLTTRTHTHTHTQNKRLSVGLLRRCLYWASTRHSRVLLKTLESSRTTGYGDHGGDNTRPQQTQQEGIQMIDSSDPQRRHDSRRGTGLDMVSHSYSSDDDQKELSIASSQDDALYYGQPSAVRTSRSTPHDQFEESD